MINKCFDSLCEDEHSISEGGRSTSINPFVSSHILIKHARIYIV